ncbi:hypothetical protein LCGC14_2864560 [marine sediment metagenome]|uniref:DUF721 domain-containing protein n=1 Tax=marine sediment metagenome TaxID=412755 RepID=A0A0F8YRH3_9ZZZZ
MRPRRIRRILNTILRRLGLEKRIKECAILSFWNDAVGESIASHTKPVKVYDGRMTVLVESSSWTQELTFLKSGIMERLNSTIGKKVIKDIYFKIGEIKKSFPEEKKEKTIDFESVKLDKEKREKIEESLEKIEDPEIREILKNFLTKEAKYETIRDEKGIANSK